MDIRYLFEQIKNSRHVPFECSFLDMKILSKTRKGYMSIFTFQCEMCNVISTFKSEMSTNTTPCLPINKAVVNGSLSIGMYN